MKKTIAAALLLSMIIIASCKKNDTAPDGSWTFEGVKYSASSAVYSRVDSSLTATSTSHSNPGTLSFYFPAATVKAGSYIVANFDSVPLDSNKLYIKFINSATTDYYFSMGNDNVTANVSISPAGKISVSVPPVYIKSYSAAMSDSAQMTATINQQ